MVAKKDFNNKKEPAGIPFGSFQSTAAGRMTNEDLLNESYYFISRILDTTPNFIYIHDIVENRNVYANREVWNFLGYSCEQIKAFGSSLMRNILHPDDARAVMEHHARFRTIGDNEILEIEYRMKQANGEWRWLRSRDILFSRDSQGGGKLILGTSEDITERKRSTDALKESEAKLRDYLENVPDGVFVIDENGNFIHVNGASCGLLGYSEEELRRMNVNDLLAEESREDGIAHFTRIKERGAADADLYHVRKNGVRICLSINAVKTSGNRILGFAKDITERVMMEDALKRSEELYRSLFENMLNGVAYCRMIYKKEVPVDFIYISVNETFQTLTGFKKITCKKMSEIIPDFCKTDAQLLDIFGRVALTGRPEKLEVYVKSMKIWLSVSVYSPERDYFVAVFDVVTERKEAEEALKRTVERLDMAKTVTHLGIWDYDIMERKIVCDDLIYELFGKKPAEGGFTFETWLASVYPDDNPEEEIGKLIKSGKNDYDSEFRVIWPDGSIHYLRVHGLIVRDPEGKPIRITGTIYDITDHKRAEEEHMKLEQQLQRNQRLESLGILAGGIAHDFNNLMGGVFGFVDLAKEICKDEKCAALLSKALNSIVRARGLTNQLLTFAKGGAPIRKIDSLSPFIEETALFALSGSNFSCQFDISKDLWSCCFDKNQMGQVIDNIVINAMQSKKDGGQIEIFARNVVLGDKEYFTLPAGNYVKISIHDSGTGIPPEILPRIFDPFYTTKEKGHGLGLATCHSIITRHGGYIDVESELGKGSTFHLFLPASDGALSSEGCRLEHDFKGNGIFLVMDDEEVMRETLKDMLELLGFNVVCTENGKDAVDFVSKKTGEGRKIAGMIFDLTIAGGLGGIDSVKEIRKMTSDTPIFVASGYAQDPVMANPSEYGFTSSIGKPFRLGELREMLRRYMG